MSQPVRIAIKILLPLIILGGALGAARTLIKSRPQAPKQERQVSAYLVETLTTTRAPHRIDVTAQGIVQASAQLLLQPQVAGRITSIHPQLVPGGLIPKGDLLVRIDPADYKIAVQEAETTLEDARARFEVERGQQVIAQREWELFQGGSNAKNTPNTDPSLALRRPQLKIAQVAIDAAEARSKRARVELERTTLKAPFDALVLNEQVEVGQLVTQQTSIATLVGTDAFWVRASVPLDQLARLNIPGLNAQSGQGSRVTIEQDLGGQIERYDGHVLRLLGELDQVGRMAQLLIEIPDPLGLKSPSEGRKTPLLIGSYVVVKFEGSQQRELVELPRRALHDGQNVWLYTADETLEVRRVTIAATQPDTVLISDGLSGGEHIIVSRIAAPIPGMKLRTSPSQKTAARLERSSAGEP